MTWSVASHLAFAQLLATFLGFHPASAQFLGDLAKLSPKQITDTIHDDVRQKIADAMDKSPKDLASQAFRATASEDGKEASKAMKALAQDSTAKRADQAVQDPKLQGQEHVGKALKVSGQSTTKSSPSTHAEHSAAPMAGPVDTDPHKAEALDALQAVKHVLRQASDTVNQTRSSVVTGVLNRTNTEKLAQTVKDAMPSSPAEALKPETLEKAKKSFETAKVAVRSSPQLDAVKAAGTGLAKAFGLAGPGSAKAVIEQVHPDAAGVLRKTHEAVKQTGTQDVQSVAHAIGSGSPDKVRDALRGAARPDARSAPSAPGGQGSSSGRWALMGAMLVGAAAFSGWQLMKHSGVHHKATPASREPLFRQEAAA